MVRVAGLIVPLAVACGGGGATLTEDAAVDGRVDPIAGYDEPADFDRTACVAGSLAGRDPQGIYHLQIDLDGQRQTAAMRFDVLGPAQFAGLLHARDATHAIATDDDLFLYRRVDATSSRSLDLCAADADGLLRGQYATCNIVGCLVGTVVGKRVDRLVEAPASGLVLVGEHAGPTWNAGATVNVRVRGDYAYLARAEDGLRILDLRDPGAIVDVGHGPVESDGTTNERYNDVKLIAVGPARYAIMASNRAGAVVWDVTDPRAPRIVAHLGTPVDDRPLGVHTLAIDGTRAYLANPDRGLEIYDVADPAAPRRLGQFPTPNAATGRFLHDLSIRGDRAYLNFWGGGMVVVDIADPTRPVALGTFAGYGDTTSHSNWVTTIGARQIAVHGDEQWGAHVRLVDVTEGTPGFVDEVGAWQLRPEVSVHNVMAFGTIAYVAHYQDGVRLLDLADPSAPRQVAWFNTWPGYDRSYGHSFFEGAVGIDVDRTRRRVYVADSNRGLLILSDIRP